MLARSMSLSTFAPTARRKPWSRVVASCLLGPAMLAACSDVPSPSGPDAQLTVSLSLDVIEDRGGSTMNCVIGVRATANGAPGARARWGEALVDHVSPVDPSQVIGQTRFTSAQIHGLVGSPDIQPGLQVLYDLRATDDFPFAGVLRQRYQPAWTSDVLEASQPFTCGPQPQAGGNPVIVQFTAPDSLEPGGLGTLAYRVTSEPGLWRLDFFFNGALLDGLSIDLAGESEVDDTLFFTVPSLPVGSVLTLDMAATDLLGQSTVDSADDVMMTDLTGPDLIGLPRCKLVLPFCPSPAGREVHVDITTVDASPHTVLYTLGDPPIVIDSIPRPAGYTNDILRLPVTETEAGRHTLTVWARDEVGRVSPDTLRRDVLTYPRVQVARSDTVLPGTVTDIIIDTPRDRVYIAREDQPGVLALSASTLDPVTTFALGAAASGLDLTPGGDSLIVAVGDSLAVAVVDPDGTRATEFVPLDAGWRPEHVRVAADGTWLIQSGGDMGAGPRTVIVEVDPGGQQAVIDSAGNAGAWTRMVAADDRSRIAIDVGCTRVYDSGIGLSAACGTDETVEMGTDGSGSVFGDLWRTLSPAWDVLSIDHPIGDRVESVEFSPDGARMLILSADGIHVVDRSAWEPTLFIEGPFSTGRLLLSPDASYGFVWGDNWIGPSVGQTPITRIDLTPVAPSPRGQAPT